MTRAVGLETLWCGGRPGNSSLGAGPTGKLMAKRAGPIDDGRAPPYADGLLAKQTSTSSSSIAS
jgi:hypothetical protein